MSYARPVYGVSNVVEKDFTLEAKGIQQSLFSVMGVATNLKSATDSAPSKAIFSLASRAGG
jgi:hypothetical protein